MGRSLISKLEGLVITIENFKAVEETKDADLVFPVFAELSKLKKLQQLYLGSNFFSGMLPVEIGLLSSLRTLDLSTNKLQGSIPHSLENLSSLVKLSIGDNHLIGSIPQEISKLQNLERLDISNNSLSASVLSSFDVPQFNSFDRSSNKFYGRLPSNMTGNFLSLDLSNNNISGNLPHNLTLVYTPVVIDIGANYMSSLIPREIAETSNLQGSVPSCFHKNSAWVNGSRTTIRASTDAHVGLENEYVEVVNFYKGNEYGYSGIVLSVDLIVLNISNNHPNGTIPDSFAELSQIEVLDLSHNMLKGRIPSDLVAYNDLEGAVPIVNNFQTFEESSYWKECSENPKLWGYPRKKCSQLQQEDKENEEKISRWVGDKPVLYACIALGFIVGFSGVLWFLFLSKKWRFVWFKAMDGPFHCVFCGHE
ncbi:hypothetical protein AMTRI_Chr04g182520 [Amborella trichopoda]